MESSPPKGRGQARGNFTPPPRTAASSTRAPDGTAAGGSRLSPKNWRVPTRLNAILLLPVVVALVFGGLQVNNSIQTWQQAQDAERTARLVRAAADYGHALIDERDRTAVPLLRGDRDNRLVVSARAATDEAKREFDAKVADMPDTPGLQRRLKAFKDAEGGLSKLREAAYTRALPAAQTEEGYVRVQHPLMEFANELGLGTSNITSYGRTVYALGLSKAAESLQRAIGTHLLVRPATDSKSLQQQRTAFTSYAYLENIALAEYVSGSTAADQKRLRDTLVAAKKAGATKIAKAQRQARAAGVPFVAPPPMEKMIQAIGSGRSRAALKAQGITPETWFATATGKFNAYRAVEEYMTDQSVKDTQKIAEDAKQDAFITGGIAILALLAAFFLAGLMARSMSRNMLSLRNAAFDVAEQRLPSLVDQLSRTDPGRVDTRVRPIDITSQDEIGEIARAFDQVHREAVRLAAEQALLRGNVNAIFTNLSSRNQGLIERQLTLITNLENNEADPDQLENLFKLDHLATRMRRNGENLLILAGEDPGRRWTQPVPLVDILRAASSEVENYERIELTGVPESEIHGTTVTDLVHLLAELLENATSFSSPQTKVRVTATRLPDGRVMVEIHDKGIGLTAEDFADINHKLANPPKVDAAISQRMGLYVVGRLADRHGIRVQLRPSGEQSGTTSLVMLPSDITHGGGGEDQIEDDFTVSRIVPAQPNARAQEGEPLRTAEELGFDDSRFSVPDDARELDSVSRSLRRGERHAQMESGAPEAYAGEQQDHPRPGVPRNDYAQGGYGQEYAREDYAHDDYAQSGYPQSDYAQSGYGDQDYQAPRFAQPSYNEPAGSGGQTFDAFNSQARQGDWNRQGVYDGGRGSGFGVESEPPAAPAGGSERVGFDGPGPSSSETRSVTGSGLPRRDRAWQEPEGQERTQPVQQDRQEDDPDWRSANDARWQRAEQVREPKAGGVTSSGLPRRVPKANLVDGTAEATPQGGPQVSRAPEDVRGRLSNLRRGVQQGRNAGTDTNRQGFGPGSSTYDQER
ncbi:sensor histidine kinase [Streptomyces meridianus]|uniref:histidine kinase n=1 Tax=Streptomyces meridianus TaxID=2938945 RepID=A0ABT0XFN5_9ACTN|nr:nitrate- and nitrite sensing domain-containing protein [Streptomyces meridianus]MCM2580639.1 nitrate- and nitrite sensing domain-containing protein [Streptomyces meridianus]